MSLKRFSQLCFGLLFLANLLALLSALGLEHWGNVEPCPLCILQRMVVLTLILTSLLSFWLAHRHKLLSFSCHSLTSLLLLSSLFISARYVWIQHLPIGEAPPACGASVEYLMQIMPWLELLKTILTGSGECQAVVFSVLGLSFATWTLLYFFAMTCVYFWALLKLHRP